MFIKQYDEGHIRDRLYIYWDVTTVCNFECDYCYARDRYLPKNEWNLTDAWKRQLVVLKALSFSKYPIYLGFHGGEPTLHPKFFELVELTLQMLSKKENSQLYIVTNGSTNVFKVIKEKNLFSQYKDKLRFLFSYHPTQMKNPEKFINNARIMTELGFKTKVNTLLVQDKNLWEPLKRVFLECNEFTKVHPHFIYDNINGQEILREYTPEFYEYFKFIKKSECYYVLEDENGVKYNISDYELFRQDLNRFKGWKCWNNNYEIMWDGMLNKICDPVSIDLIVNPWYIKNLRIKPMICPYDHCHSDGVLKCIKEK